MEVKCLYCSGLGHYEVTDLEESRVIWSECIECEGEGTITINNDENE
jgi:DnaJ-class molecular chaperone